MQVRTDDEMYRVDRTYLGPKGRRLPWRATYRGYGVWIAVALLLGMVMLRAGAPISMASVVLLLTLSVLATLRIMKVVDYERPLRPTAVMIWHELTAPRPLTAGARGERYELRVKAKRWGPNAEPTARWWRRGLRQNVEVDR